MAHVGNQRGGLCTCSDVPHRERPRREARPQQRVSLAGIDPKLRQSGPLQGQVRMSKQGSCHLRRAIYLACQKAMPKRPLRTPPCPQQVPPPRPRSGDEPLRPRPLRDRKG
ncbi:transposase [Candidatus Bipolaricaulota bacterium]|nr:transposase [Candidatus Bipolaricaulota bacterium]